MTMTEIEARQLEAGDELVRTTKAGTVIRITISYVGYGRQIPDDPDSYAVEWEGESANRTPRSGLFHPSEMVQVVR